MTNIAKKNSTYMRDELVPLLLADQVLEVEQEVKPFLIGNAGECIVRILALEIHHQLGEFVIVSKVFHGVGQRFPSDDGREMTVRLAMNGSQDPSLQVHGPSLIQPEMLPRGIGDEVAAPAVGELVRNDINVFSVLETVSAIIIEKNPIRTNL